MKEKLRPYIPIFLIFLIVTLSWLLLWWLVSLDMASQWLFVRRPPLPPGAMQVTTSYPTIGGSRIIHFESDAPVDRIREFYLSELSRRGWDYLCSTESPDDQACTVRLSPSSETVDVYRRDNKPGIFHSLSVEVYKPGEYAASMKSRVVWVVETRYSYLARARPEQTSSPPRITLTPGVYPWPGADTPTPILQPAYP